MDNGWYYAEDGRAIGPLTLPELVEMLAKIGDAGQLMVWHEAYDDWIEAKEARELKPYFVNQLPLPAPSRELWSGRNVGKLWRWALAPIIFGVIVFGIHYGRREADNSKIGLVGQGRLSFIATGVVACIKNQNESPENKDISALVISQYCQCYMSNLADMISNNELKSKATDKEIFALLQPRMLTAARPCQEAIGK